METIDFQENSTLSIYLHEHYYDYLPKKTHRRVPDRFQAISEGMFV
jgi:hypothetical protein